MKECGKYTRRPLLLALSLPPLLLGSCAASLNLVLNTDGSGFLTADAQIPPATAARLQTFRSVGMESASEPTPFFDAQAIRKETALRGITMLSAEIPTPNRFKGSFSIPSLAAMTKDPALSESGLIQLNTSAGESTLAFSLSRKNAKALSLLFPGLDPSILDALSPPALDPYPVTESEYREMLTALLGETAMKELDTAFARVTIRAPGSITQFSGGSVSEKTLTVNLKFLDLLVLETPIRFSVSWR